MRRIRKITAFLLNVCLVLGICGMQTITLGAREMDSSDWMAEIEDDVSLSEISIPGTHDTCTQYVSLGYIFQCQDTGIVQQLENGYRYMDMRIVIGEKDGEEALVMKHNFASCKTGKSPFASKLYFQDVAKDVVTFLEQHPTETVILCMKAENGEDSVKTVQKLLYEIIEEKSDYWYLENRIPTMSEVRGKIVLATRFEDALELGEERRGLCFAWEDQGEKEVVDIPYVQSQINQEERLWVQDRYNYDTEDKIEAVVDNLENCQTSEDTFLLNFASTSGSGAVGHPKKYATAINNYLLEYEWQEQTCYGVVVVDFATEPLARCIYETN